MDAVDLEVGHRLTHVRLPAPHRELRSLSRADAKGDRRLVEQRQGQRFQEESFRALEIGNRNRRHHQGVGQHGLHLIEGG